MCANSEKTRPPTMQLPAPLRRRLEAAVAQLFEPRDGPRVDFANPSGEPALTSPHSVSWQVFKNPVVLFIGGVSAVILELAEPRVRTGVWEHTSFRECPMERLRRTALATAVTVYGPRSRAQAMIAHVNRLHLGVAGSTPNGQLYRASDPELLDWVHATASFGFLQAYHTYVRPLSDQERDRFYAEGLPAARLYGAVGAPRSQATLDALFERTRERLEPSPILLEFLRIVASMPGLPWLLRPMQPLLIRAAVQITPFWARERLDLGADWTLRHGWQRRIVMRLAGMSDRLVLRSSPAVQACRRLGLPDDFLYGRPAARHPEVASGTWDNS